MSKPRWTMRRIASPIRNSFRAAPGGLSGIRPDEAIFLTDNAYAAEAAQRCGIQMIGLLSGGFAASDMLRADSMAIYRINRADLLENYDRSPLVEP